MMSRVAVGTGSTCGTAATGQPSMPSRPFDILYATKGAGGGSDFEAETLNVYAYGLTF